MSSPSRPWVGEEREAAAKDGCSENHEEEESTQNVEKDADSDAQMDQDCNSSSSDSSTLLKEVKSGSDMPPQKRESRKFKSGSCNVRGGKHRSRRVHVLAYSDKTQNQNHRTLKIKPKSSAESVPKDYYKTKEVGNLDCEEPFVCSMYITSYNVLEDELNIDVGLDPITEVLSKIASGKIRLQKTFCGIVAAFTKEDDADKALKLPLQKIFGGPIQVAKFLTGEHKFRRNVIIKDIPWCISNIEIHEALKMQGIMAGKVTRTRSHVKIEVLNALDMQRLLEEGFNFFTLTSFMVVPETTINQGEPDIIQCFKCQGFWHTSTHCRQIPRCVRCGENHDVEYCPRPRSTPICCHCGGPHHAAYKMCPVRLQHINSTYVGFQLAKNKPDRSLQHNMF